MRNLIYVCLLLVFLSFPLQANAAETVDDAIAGLQLLWEQEYIRYYSDGTIYQKGKKAVYATPGDWYMCVEDNSQYSTTPEYEPRYRQAWCLSSDSADLKKVTVYTEYDLNTGAEKVSYPSSSISTSGKISGLFKNFLVPDEEKYLSQFLGEGETIADMNEFFANDTRYLFGDASMFNNNSNCTVTSENINLPILKITQGVEGPGILTQAEQSCTIGTAEYLSFFYVPDGEDKPPHIDYPSNGESNYDSDKLPTLNIKVEEEVYWSGFRRLGRYDFIWNYNDYSIYKENPNNYFIEFRYIRGKQEGFIDGRNINIIPDDDLNWTYLYNHFDEYVVSKNLCSGYLKDIIDTYGFGLAGSFHGVFEIRVCSSDYSRFSNWVRISTNSVYGNAFKIDEIGSDGSISNIWLNGNNETYPDGSDSSSDVNDYIAGNPNMSENTDTNANINANVDNIIVVLKGLVSTVGSLPDILSEVLSFLPSEFFALIGVSLSLIVAVSFIKWFT